MQKGVDAITRTTEGTQLSADTKKNIVYVRHTPMHHGQDGNYNIYHVNSADPIWNGLVDPLDLILLYVDDDAADGQAKWKQFLDDLQKTGLEGLQQLGIEQLPPIMPIRESKKSPKQTPTAEVPLEDAIDRYFKEKDPTQLQIRASSTMENEILAALLKGNGFDIHYTEERNGHDFVADLDYIQEKERDVLLDQLVKNGNNNEITRTLYLLTRGGFDDPSLIPPAIKNTKRFVRNQNIINHFVSGRGELDWVRINTPSKPSPHDVRRALTSNPLQAFVGLRAKKEEPVTADTHYGEILKDLLDVDVIRGLPYHVFYDEDDFNDAIKRHQIDLSGDPDVVRKQIQRIQQRVAEKRKQKIMDYLENRDPKIGYDAIITSSITPSYSKNPVFRVKVDLPDTSFDAIVKLFDYVGLENGNRKKKKEQITNERRALSWYERVDQVDQSGTSILYDFDGRDERKNHFDAIIMRRIGKNNVLDVLDEAKKENNNTLIDKLVGEVMELGGRRAAFAPENLAEYVPIKDDNEDDILDKYLRDKVFGDTRSSINHIVELLNAHNALPDGSDELVNRLRENYDVVTEILCEQPMGVYTDMIWHNWRIDRSLNKIEGTDFGTLRKSQGALQIDLATPLVMGDFVDQEKEEEYVKSFLHSYKKGIQDFNRLVSDEKVGDGGRSYKKLIVQELTRAVKGVGDKIKELTASRDDNPDMTDIDEQIERVEGIKTEYTTLIKKTTA